MSYLPCRHHDEPFGPQPTGAVEAFSGAHDHWVPAAGCDRLPTDGAAGGCDGTFGIRAIGTGGGHFACDRHAARRRRAAANRTRVAIEGNMNHAGMKPSFAELTERGAGVYDGDLEFTMGGDWFILVTATLPDGSQLERKVDVKGVAVP